MTYTTAEIQGMAEQVAERTGDYLEALETLTEIAMLSAYDPEAPIKVGDVVRLVGSEWKDVSGFEQFTTQRVVDARYTLKGELSQFLFESESLGDALWIVEPGWEIEQVES